MGRNSESADGKRLLDPNGPRSVFGVLCKPFKRIGGDDETRTRDLCRDRLGAFVFSATYILNGGCQVAGRNHKNTGAVGKAVGENFSTRLRFALATLAARGVRSECRVEALDNSCRLIPLFPQLLDYTSQVSHEFPLAGDCTKMPSGNRFYGDLAARSGKGRLGVSQVKNSLCDHLGVHVPAPTDSAIRRPN